MATPTLDKDLKIVDDDQFEKGSRLGDEDHVINTVPMPESLAALSEAERKKIEKRATLKLDCVILSGVVIMYILNYLDRQNISAARLAGIQEDLNLSDVQYQTAVSILFVGYIVREHQLFQVPSNMIVSSVKHPGVYINIAMVAWGLLSACTAEARSYGALLAIRIILGIIEAAFFPGAMYYITTFYNRSQLAVRTAILFSGSQFGNAFGNLIAIGILKLDGQQGIAGWRWLFLVEGAITIFIGLIFAACMPSSPRTTKLLNEQERELVLYNFSVHDYGNDDEEQKFTQWESFKMCILDIKTWMMMGMLSTLFAAAVVQFFPSVVETLGFERKITYTLCAPPYLLCVVTSIANGLHSDKKKERFWHVVWPSCLIIVANVIALATLNTGARYFSMMLMPTSTYAAGIVVLSWISATLNEPKQKRAAAYAVINSLANTPNIWCSYLYTGAPHYYPAFGVNLAAGVGALAITFISWTYLKRCNAKLDKGEAVYGVTQHQIDRGFRFML